MLGTSCLPAQDFPLLSSGSASGNPSQSAWFPVCPRAVDRKIPLVLFTAAIRPFREPRDLTVTVIFLPFHEDSVREPCPDAHNPVLPVLFENLPTAYGF